MRKEPKLADCPECGENVAVECTVYGMVSVKPTHSLVKSEGHRLMMSVCTECGQVVRMWVHNPEDNGLPMQPMGGH